MIDNKLPIALSTLSAILAGGVATASAQSADAEASEARKPNVILLIADDLGYGDLQCYGARNVETPNVNALADSGIRFANAHATAATSTPSRYSLLTGEYAWRRSGTGVAEGNAGSIIGADRYTMADMFHDAGYTTGAIGKWHLGLGSKTGQQNWNGKIDVTPRDLGFDYHYIQAATADRVPCVYLEQDTVANYDPTAPISVSYASNFAGEPTGVSNRSELKLDWSHGHNQSIVDGISRIGYMKGGGKALWKDENIADSIAAHTARFITENKENPFFLYLCTNDVHVPRWPHERFRGKNIMGLRGDAIAQFDWTVGEVMKALEENGLTENTLIILSSDNGPMLDDGYVDYAIEKLNGHQASGGLRGYKYSGYEGGTRVPFIVSWPQGVDVASEPNETLISHIDLFASLGKMIGVELPAGAAPDSGDQLDQILGKSLEHRPWVAEQNHTNAVSIRTDRWKYIPANNGGQKVSWISDQDMQYVENANSTVDQLYDLIEDPAETTNVASEHPDIITLMRELKQECVSGPAKPFTPPMSSTDEVSYWYTLKTPLRGNLYLTQNGTILRGQASANKERSQWCFIEREDGTFDIMNRNSGEYINPASAGNDQNLRTSATVPSMGWKCDYAATDGLLVFYTTDTSAQFNMGNDARSNRLLNWGGGRHDDDGCQYLVELVETEEHLGAQLPSEAATPAESTAEAPVWYTICATGRDESYIAPASDEATLRSVRTVHYSPSLAWRIERRPDESYDLINLQAGQYLAPVTVSTDDKRFTLSDATPASGWKLKAVNSAPGHYIIVSGSKQVCVDEDYSPINYGGGMSTSNAGVQFRFTDVTAIANGESGIAAVEAATEAHEVWYDVYGRRVANPRHGIFISTSGRKVIL